MAAQSVRGHTVLASTDRAAFASLQPRLFGSWDRALHGAGLDADEVNRYRKWKLLGDAADVALLPGRHPQRLDGGAVGVGDRLERDHDGETSR